jgi:3-deoxy-D-manno-octulosonate 8-phosphate phosphatase (KDO 8-P phosphatase)
MNLNLDNQQFIFANIFEYFKKINTFIFDVDGVLTNNDMLITEAGELLRTMSARDGFAIKHALQSGYRIAIITGGRSQGVIKRLQGLGIKDIFSGIEDKLPIYRNYLKENKLSSDTILYMGDDLPDLDIMRYVGLAACPADATPEVIEKCNYISPLNGGAGCVRDVIEKTMKLRGHWNKKTNAVSS